MNWDHAKHRYSLSINIVRFLYTVATDKEDTMQINLPIAFEVVSKTASYTNKKTVNEKMKSPRPRTNWYGSANAGVLHF